MSDEWVMRVLADDTLDAPAYLAYFDVDAYGGIGECALTTDITQALRFDDLRTLFETWKMQSQIVPTRGDGKPNRPLTAMTIMPEKYPTTTEETT